jgi:predicted dinucleotide-binding enzyme
MLIAIIGAGNVGSGLSRATVSAGHTAVVTASHPEKAETVAARTGARAARSVTEAVDQADAVVLAVPHPALTQVADELAVAVPRVVVDATNPLNAAFTDLDMYSCRDLHEPPRDACCVAAARSAAARAISAQFCERRTA